MMSSTMKYSLAVVLIATFAPPARAENLAGPGWETEQLLSTGSDNIEPAVAVRGPWVHVVWRDQSTSELRYRRSRDGGRSWDDVRVIDDSAGATSPSIDTRMDEVHIVYRVQGGNVAYIKSTDNGTTFNTPTQLTSAGNTGYGPDIAVAGSNVFTIWTKQSGGYDVMCRRSLDGGDTWESPVDNLTSRFGSGIEELSARIAAAPVFGGGAAVMIVWVEVDWPNVYAYSSYSASTGDPGTWTSRYTLWSGPDAWRSVAITSQDTMFHVDRESTSNQGPAQRQLDPYDGLGWSSSVDIGFGGDIGGMDGSAYYDLFGANVYRRGSQIYVSTGPGTETLIGSGEYEDVAANQNGNIHVVWDDGAGSIFYRRYVASPRLFTDRGKPYNLSGLYESDAQWGDLDNDGDLDLVVCGQLSDGTARTHVVVNLNGQLHHWTSTSQYGVHSTGSGNLDLGDYDGDGDLDLAMAGLTFSNGEITHVYNNPGDGAFDWNSPTHTLTGVQYASVAWGDYDGDGDLDLYVQGHDGATNVANLYVNDPIGTLTVDATFEPTALRGGSVDWADWDNDGDFDLLTTGSDGTDRRIVFYESDPVGNLVDAGDKGLPGFVLSDAAWGDYDNDGDLDLAVTGDIGAGLKTTEIYENDGTGEFSLAASPRALYRSSCAWGDVDNDGDLDFALIGYDSSSLYTEIYENDEGVFTQAHWLPGVREGSISFADVDYDGNLDAFVTGSDWAFDYVDLYANVGGELDSVPSEPTSLYCIPAGRRLIMNWTEGLDGETSLHGLYYNVRAGTASGAHDVFAGTYATPLMGSAHQASELTVHTAPGLYYFSVQTIDTGFAKSIWSEEFTCIVPPGRPDAGDDVGVTCLTDPDCPTGSHCAPGELDGETGNCYVYKNRDLTIDANPINPDPTARSVRLDDGSPDGIQLGWVGEPVLQLDGLYLSTVVATPYYTAWPDTLQVEDCEISPGHTYLIDTIEQGADLAEPGNYSNELVLTTPAWGDAVGNYAGTWQGPNGVVNVVDIQAIVLGFSLAPTAAPRSWLDLDPQVPNYVVNFVDVLRGVQAFKLEPYPFDDPCTCAGIWPPCP